MTISAIISEYNPIHKGHVYHMEQTRELTGCDKVMVIMSGSFTQRGEPAVFSKWARAEAAVKAGADIVLELPTVFATAGAERFAAGAVSIAESTCIADFLSFGSECGNIEQIKIAADFFANESDEYKETLKTLLARGMTFAAARTRAAETLLGRDEADVIREPNNILAVEYMKAIIKQSSRMKPVTVKRVGSSYDDEVVHGDYPSALAIRRALRSGTYEAGCDEAPVFADAMFEPLMWRIRTSSPEELAKIAEIGEGLEYRIIDAAASAHSYEELIAAIKSKRYTLARIKRALLNIFLGITDDLLHTIDFLPCYARVLAVKKESRDLLSLLAKASKIPVITSPVGIDHPSLLLDIEATDLRTVIAGGESCWGEDYSRKLLII